MAGIDVPASDGTVLPNNVNCDTSSSCVDVEIGDICGKPRNPVIIDVGIDTADLAVPKNADGSTNDDDWEEEEEEDGRLLLLLEVVLPNPSSSPTVDSLPLSIPTLLLRPIISII